MNKVINMQPWLTLFQTTGAGITADPTEVIQPQESWVDTQGYELAVLTMDILGLTGTDVSLDLEGCDDLGGSWKALYSYTVATSPNTPEHVELLSEAGPDAAYRLTRWLRWRINNSNTNDWQMTFRMNLLLKDDEFGNHGGA